MSAQPVKLDYEGAPSARRNPRGAWQVILFIPSVASSFLLLGIADGLADGGFPDEGPMQAALCAVLAAGLALIGAILAAGRSHAFLFWNGSILSLAMWGFLQASSR